MRPRPKGLARLAGGVRKSAAARSGLQERAKIIEETSKQGYDVSEVFPWYRQGITPATPAASGFVANTNLPVVPSSTFFGAEGESAFKNDTDGLIKINRLSFCQFLIEDTQEDLLSRISVKINSESQDLLNKWMPITTLHTDPEHYIYGQLNQGTWVLPTPYFLKAGQIFLGRIFSPTTSSLSEKELTIALKGYNPIDYDPIVMATTVTFPVFNAYAYNTFSFLENRDAPLRDMVIEEISVALSDSYDILDNYGHFLDQVFLEFEPPEGPKWSQDILVPMAALTTQMNVDDLAGNNTYRPIVVHEPIEPYTLEPGQSIQMMMRPLNTYQTGLIGVTAVGTQRGRREL